MSLYLNVPKLQIRVAVPIFRAADRMPSSLKQVEIEGGCTRALRAALAADIEELAPAPLRARPRQ